MKIDAAVHFWKYEKTIPHPFIQKNKLLQQHYLPEQITQSLQRNGMDGCIAVVAENAEVETRFLSELALTHPVILGVVGWIDLYSPKATEKIQEFQQYKPIRGFRIETRKGQFPAKDVMELLQQYEYCLEFSSAPENDPAELKNWMNLYPEQTFILQDCGNPDIIQAPSKLWENNIRELSKSKNLSCKVSGLLERASRNSWKPADFYPVLEVLFDVFGPGRLLFASDWPYILVAGIYVQWKSLLEKFTEKFADEDRDKFFGKNAELIYRL